ncbi:FluC/FEX family fluoride channel [Gordonia sp. KTR9]|uniref:FluC/FEX family fluoride channel n=1 Tax=Gordonia sp. KTR9 TaxID=337191 RepID=UPI00027DE456|nr:CrcB family protein [Gordonia sp. KTR9]AFR51449.1 hypothetical protein KTR9_4990 [Gordonia sp. KTR9]
MNDRHDPASPLSIDPDSPPLPAATPLHFSPAAVAAVAAGGVAGTWLRYQLGVWFPHTAGTWPATTFVINIGGAFLLGLLLEALSRLGPDTRWRQRARLAGGTGLLGTFTTYSALAVDTTELLRDQLTAAAVAYALGTVVAGVVAAVAGIAVGARVRGSEERR